MTSPASLNDSGQVSSLSLSSNDRVSNFYWTRGSKHGFLTSLSYFDCYFLILCFLQTCYLLVSSPFLSCTEIKFLYPVFSYIGHSKVVHSTCAPMFLVQIALFPQRTRCLWDSGSRLSTGFASHFLSLPKVSGANVHWAIAYHTFLFYT